MEEYILQHITPEHPYLHDLYRATHLHLLRPRMASGHLQGQLLRIITSMVRPRVAVEIGTYSGYSALAIASAMEDGATLHTFEINDEQEDFTRPWIEGSPWAGRIDFRIGDVMQLLPAMNVGPIDMAFVDANKRQYVDYYEFLLPRLRSGGYLLADNTLWDGHVTDPAYDRDAQTCGIRAFNERVAADSRVECVILPLRDGLTLIRKR